MTAPERDTSAETLGRINYETFYAGTEAGTPVPWAKLTDWNVHWTAAALAVAARVADPAEEDYDHAAEVMRLRGVVADVTAELLRGGQTDGIRCRSALMVLKGAGVDFSKPAAPRDLAAERVAAEFTGWMEAQGYDITDDDRALAEAFAAGMQAERDLAAARPAAPVDAADKLIRDILESLCRRDGASLESAVVPGEPARNYELAERLGIGHVFGLPSQPAAPVRQSARADEFARVKVKLCALVASLEETVNRGTHAEEFDQGAAHASAVTARQISAILDETAMRAAPLTSANNR